MLLNLLLFFMLLTFIVFLVMIYVWWKNFGSDLIKTTKEIMRINNQILKKENNGKNITILDQLKVIRNYFNKKNLKL